MWTTTDYDRPQQRVACAAVGSCELVVQLSAAPSRRNTAATKFVLVFL
jgi:hypothetical protein